MKTPRIKKLTIGWPKRALRGRRILVAVREWWSDQDGTKTDRRLRLKVNEARRRHARYVRRQFAMGRGVRNA